MACSENALSMCSRRLFHFAGPGLFCQTYFKIALQAAVGFLKDLLITETQFHFRKPPIPFGKGQGWYFNPFQLRKSTFSSTIVGLTVFNFHIPLSAFRIPNSKFQIRLYHPRLTENQLRLPLSDRQQWPQLLSQDHKLYFCFYLLFIFSIQSGQGVIGCSMYCLLSRPYVAPAQ